MLARRGFNVVLEVSRYLLGQGHRDDGEQQTKTKTALEFYAAELQAQRS